MELAQNFDLLSVGVVTAAIGILGFVVFFNNLRSITNRTFLVFSLLTVFYGVFNYLNYQASSPFLILWFLRITIFFAVWHAFYFLHFFLVFPKEHVQLSRWYKRFLIPVTLGTSILTLTPLVFSRIEQVAIKGSVSNPVRGPGIAVFGALVVFLVGYGIIILFKKTKNAVGLERAQFKFVSAGTFLTFSLLVVFNFVLPVIFNNLRFIPLAPVFIFPFIVATTYSIIRHRFLDVKVVATEILAFVLAITTLLEVIFAEGLFQLIFRISMFSLVLFFGILLIRSVIREVEQRKKLQVLTTELQVKNDKLVELDRLKSEFLSFASHQVKAPMTVVKGYASLIFDGTYGAVSEKIRETTEKIVASADRMIALVNNLLDLRRIQEGRMDYSFETVEARGLVSSVAEELRTLAEKKGLKFSFSCSIDGAKAKIDKQKFRQVIQNLVDNAIKYTEKGDVGVSLDYKSGDKKRVVISVSDSGIGIPDDLLPHLFQQFARGSGAAKKIQGTGLGLYIAKEIMMAHNGDITAESAGEGKGSVFKVEVPVIEG